MLMLETNLKHIETVEQYNELLESGKKFVAVCGRMGPMCIPVYDVMDNLQDKYPDIEFYDMVFDSYVGRETILKLPECRSFYGLPFTIYYKDGKVVSATGGIQNKKEIKEILDTEMN